MDTWIGTLSQFDLGAQWLLSLFTEGASPLNATLTVLSGVLAAIAGFAVAWHVLSGIVATAHDGRVLGQRWHQIWAPIRVVLGFGLLLPISAVGMSGGQLLVREVAGAGSSMANQVWSAFSRNVLESGHPVVPVSAHGRELVRQLLLLETCGYAVSMEAPAAGFTFEQPDAAGAIGTEAVVWDYSPVCGSLRFTMPANHLEFADARRQAVTTIVTQIRSAAARAASSLMPGAEVALDPANAPVLVQALNQFAAAYDDAIANAAASASVQVDAATREKLATYGEQHGWVTAGVFWRTISQSSEIAIGLTSETFEVEAARDRVPLLGGGSNPSLPDVQNAVAALRAYIDSGASEVRRSASDLAFAGDADTDLLTRILVL
jgi:conjugal transfer/type IV secretion protein DotA/TraY